MTTVRAAVVQAAPVAFDRGATLAKVHALAAFDFLNASHKE